MTLQELIEKYNARTERDERGWHGCNSLGAMRYDSRALKKHLNRIMKDEFPGLKYSLSVRMDSCYPVKLKLTGKPAEMFRPYDEIGLYSEGRTLTDSNVWKRYFSNSPVCRVTSYGEPFQRRVYEHYLVTCRMDIRNAEDAEILAEPYRTACRFFLALMDSYSYDHSDTMSDYFDSGIDCEILTESDISAMDPADILAGADMLQISDEMQIFDRFPMKESEDGKTAQRLAEWKARREAERKAWEEENARRRAEIEAEEAKWKAERAEALQGLQVRDIPEAERYIIRGGLFSHWNKPSDIKEAFEYANEHTEEGTIAMIVREVSITRKGFETLANNLIADWPEICKGTQGESIGGCCHVKDADPFGPELDYEECYRMGAEGQKANGIAWMRACVLVTVEGHPELLIDPSGHMYCRYVGFVTEEARIERQGQEPGREPSDPLAEANATIAEQAAEIARLTAMVQRLEMEKGAYKELHHQEKPTQLTLF